MASPWIKGQLETEYVEKFDLGGLEYLEAWAYDDACKPLGRYLAAVERGTRDDSKKKADVWLKLNVLAMEDSYFRWYVEEEYANPGWYHICNGDTIKNCGGDDGSMHIG